MKLENIRFYKNKKLYYGSVTFEDNIEKIQYSDNTGLHSPILIPAYTDIHCHGGFGYDIMDSNAEELCIMGEKLLETGTGAYMPTLVSGDVSTLEKAIENIATAKEKHRGAKILGVHMEGTFISKNRSGIMDEKYIYNMDPTLLDRFLSYGLKLRITVAPENNGAMEFIKYAKEKDCYVSMGHSLCTAEQALEAVEKGADCVTHIFNAMKPMGHREPNLSGIGLSSDIYCEMICDTYHIDPHIMNIVYKTKGSSKGIIISDGMCAMGMKEGKYTFCGKDVYVKNGKATDINGTLAGSICTMHGGVLGLMKATGESIENILPWAIENPAYAVGEEPFSIEEGTSPTLLLLDEKYNIKNAFRLGD